jgi:hypothetical protein
VSTRVVNIRHEPYASDPSLYAYIGRKGRGQDGYFGNPVLEKTPSGLAKYRAYFRHRLTIDPSFKQRVEALRGKVLGCFCAPGPCHGDVIAQWLDGRGEDFPEWKAVNEKIRDAPRGVPSIGARVRVVAPPVRWNGPPVVGRDGVVENFGQGALEGFLLVALDRAREELRGPVLEVRPADVVRLEPQATLFGEQPARAPRAGGDPS